MSRPARALWIEILSVGSLSICVTPSRPARALWIEITTTSMTGHGYWKVEAREGLVD